MNSLANRSNPLFRELFSNSIGFDRLFNHLCDASNQVFPPYNISQDDKHTYVEMALAGYSKENIKVVVEDAILTIEGSATPEDGRQDIHRGIAARSFKRSFSLGEYVEVKSAELKDGLLVVVVEEVLPPEKQPKVINVL